MKQMNTKLSIEVKFVYLLSNKWVTGVGFPETFLAKEFASVLGQFRWNIYNNC